MEAIKAPVKIVLWILGMYFAVKELIGGFNAQQISVSPRFVPTFINLFRLFSDRKGNPQAAVTESLNPGD
jgi:hypothetical protein